MTHYNGEPVTLNVNFILKLNEYYEKNFTFLPCAVGD